MGIDDDHARELTILNGFLGLAIIFDAEMYSADPKTIIVAMFGHLDTGAIFSTIKSRLFPR